MSDISFEKQFILLLKFSEYICKYVSLQAVRTKTEAHINASMITKIEIRCKTPVNLLIAALKILTPLHLSFGMHSVQQKWT